MPYDSIRLPRKGRFLCRFLFCIVAFASASGARADEIVGTKSGKVYHTFPKECKAAQQISEENIVRWNSEDEARKEGRRLCKMCLQLSEKGGGKKGRSKSPDEGRMPPKSKPAAKAENEGASPTPPIGVRVKKAQLGGTLQIEGGDKVRFAGILVPQSGQPLADEAVRLIQKQLKGRRVQIAPIAGADAKPRRDSLGRLIAYVTLSGSDTDLGADLITEGLAAVDRTAEFDRRDEYLKHEDDAAWAGRGIWKKLDGPDGEVSVVTGKHTYEYHQPNCPHVAHLTEATTITVNEAKGRRLCPCELYRAAKEEEEK